MSCSTPTHAAEAAVGIDCGRARLETLAAAVRLRDHGRRAVLSRARTLTILSRAPAARLKRQRGLLHQRLRELRAGARTASGRRAGARPPAGGGARAQGILGPARLPQRRPRELERLALGLAGHDPQRTLERGYMLWPSRAGGDPLTGADGGPRRAASCDCASPTASSTPTCASDERSGPSDAAGAARSGGSGRAPRRGTAELSYEAASAHGSRRSSGSLDSGEASLDETLALLSEGKTLIELCARELAAVGDALQELRLDELVSRLEGSTDG